MQSNRANVWLIATGLMLLALLWHPECAAQSSQHEVYKCISESGRISYQQSPCEAAQDQQQMTVTGDTQANRDAAAKAAASRIKAESNRMRAEAEQAREAYRNALINDQRNRDRVAQTPPRPAEPEKPVVCPPTYENPGVMKPRVTGYFTHPNGRREALYDSRERYMRWKALPSKTYLKNAGKWPKGCPP